MLPHLEFTDMPYSGLLATVLSGVEPTVAIILACVPFLRPLFSGKPSIKPSSHYDLSEETHGVFSNKGGGSSQGRPFEELDDDSSEIQLRPLNVDMDVQVSAYATKHKSNIHAQMPKSKAITVSTQWEVDYK